MHVYLSPHLDDVVLSCGGTIARQVQEGKDVLVITVFSKVPEGELSPLAKALHVEWHLGEAAVAERRRENIRALEVLGAEGEHWDLLDAIYRPSSDGGFRYDSFDSLFREVHPEDHSIIELLLCELRAWCDRQSRPFRLYAPLAIGLHVDHVIVHETVSLLQHPLCSVLFYEDQPYASTSGNCLTEGLLDHARRWVPSISPVAGQVALKRKALGRYESQGLGKEWVLKRLMAYSQQLDSTHAHVERFWEAIPHSADKPMDAGTTSSIIRCPMCRGELQQNTNEWICRCCDKQYPVRLGIPDLRIFDPAEAGYVTMEVDLARAKRLYEAYEDLDYRGMTELLLHVSVTSSREPSDHYLAYRLAARQRAAELLDAIARKQVLYKHHNGVGLDIGCGSGVGLLALAGICAALVGVDLSLSELLCAKKLVEEHGKGAATLLVAACAEALPLRDQSCYIAIARDVYEHAPDQRSFLTEALRVLQPGTLFLFNTTSRYAPVEPHVLLSGVGFLPRFVQPFYVRLRRGREYAIHNPSLFELHRTLRCTLHDCDWHVHVPDRVAKEEYASTWKGKVARKVPGLAELINLVFKQRGPFEVAVQRRV